MNQTQDPGAESTRTPPQGDDDDDQTRQHEQQNQGPRVNRQQMLELDRLHRSNSDKYIAGVSGGLGRHFDIDPLIVRVIFVVTAFFGVGILLYGALWLLLPDDSGHAPVTTAPETRKVLLLVAGGLAGLMLLGAVLGDNWGIFPIALIALVGVAIYAVVQRKEPAGPQAAPYYSAPDRTGDPVDPAYTSPSAPQGPGMPASPHPGGYRVPRRPRRSGMILFWPTLALLAIGTGSLAVYDLENSVSHGAYPALALGIIGAMLVVGAFVGRAGGLILLGLLTIPPLLVTSAVGNNIGEAADITHRPATSTEVANDYTISNGELTLDLRGLDPTQLTALDGREIELDMNAGQITVILPDGLGYSVDAELRFAGEINVGERVVSGIHPSLTQNSRPADRAVINLDIEGVAGSIDVRQEGSLR